MPPRSRQTTSPEFMSSPTVGELIAAELETLANPPAAQVVGEQHGEFPEGRGAPVLSPTERARRSMLNRAAAEIREVHTPTEDVA